MCPKLREKKKIRESTQGGKPAEKRIHQVSTDDQSEDVYEIDKVNVEKGSDVFAILRTEIQKEDSIMTNVEVNGRSLKMEVDTGAAISIGGEEELKNQLGRLVLEPTKILLRMYNGAVEKPLG